MISLKAAKYEHVNRIQKSIFDNSRGSWKYVITSTLMNTTQFNCWVNFSNFVKILMQSLTNTQIMKGITLYFAHVSVSD